MTVLGKQEQLTMRTNWPRLRWHLNTAVGVDVVLPLTVSSDCGNVQRVRCAGNCRCDTDALLFVPVSVVK